MNSEPQGARSGGESPSARGSGSRASGQRRALLLGSQTGELKGVEGDVRRLEAFLQEQGFACRRCAGGEATRDGILAAYKAFIATCGPNDAALVYYSGHGHTIANSGYRPLAGTAQPKAPRLPFILPVDFAESTEDDFRGILALELSALLARLTARTRNVAVVLDCCHSGRMSRRPSLRTKSPLKPWRSSIVPHLLRLEAQGRFRDPHPESNPHAVRLVAAAPSQLAFELEEGGRSRGLLTEALLQALREAGTLRVTWNAIARRTREFVLAYAPAQRPEVEGPAQRFLFSLEEADRRGVLSYFRSQGRPALRGGRLHGVAPGDTYALCDLGCEEHDPARERARVEVERVTGAESLLRLPAGLDPEALPPGLPAFPLQVRPRRRPVRIRGGAPKSGLKTAIDGSPWLEAVDDEPAPGTIAQVRVRAEAFELLDAAGASLAPPQPAAALPRLLRNLERLAHAQAMRELASPAGPRSLRVPYRLEWGRVREGARAPCREPLPLLTAGERIYVRLHNLGDQTLFFSVFDIDLDARVQLATAAEPAGVEVLPGQDYILGAREPRGLRGLRLTWPAATPRSGPRLESLLALVADAPCDLRALESPGLRGASGLAIAPRLARPGGGRRGAAPAESAGDLRYAIEHLNFHLQPDSPPGEPAKGARG